VYVQKSILPTFLAAIKQAFEGIGSQLGGDPQDESTTYGPVVDKAQYDKVRAYIESGKKSAELFTGGEVYGKEGHYISPTIFVNPADDAAIYKEEIFGPVLCVKPFETEEEVLKMANNTQYGLAGELMALNLHYHFLALRNEY
jgi:aldehyde dehydrogenase (NAD+)